MASSTPADTPDVHPNIGNIYRKRVERFADALHNDDDGRIAAEELRSLIEEVVLMPGEKRGEVHAKLRGELFGILDFVEAEHRQRPGEVRTKVEASPDNEEDPRIQALAAVLRGPAVRAFIRERYQGAVIPAE